MISKRLSLGIVSAALLATVVSAHPVGEARYIANEGVMVQSGDLKILFDPIYSYGFGTYPEVPAETRAAMMAGNAPFDDVDAVFISHAHDDHFDAAGMIDYMLAHDDIRLIAPPQALDKMRETEKWDATLLSRIMAEDLPLNDSAQHVLDLGEGHEPATLSVTRLRVPHTGGERHLAVENMIYRVTLAPDATVMHLGDADADTDVFEAQSDLFGAVETDTAFAPYWFAYAPGDAKTRRWLNAEHVIAIHVPIEVPDKLRDSGSDYFSIPGETRPIPMDDHDE